MSTTATSNDNATRSRRPRRPWWRRVWFNWLLAIAFALLISCAIGVNYVLQHAGPIVRTRVLQTLSARFHAPVELDRLDISLLKGIEVEGDGLRIPFAHPVHPADAAAAPAGTTPRPMIRVDHFRFRTTFRGLLHEPTDIGLISVDGMTLDLPAGDARRQMLGGPPDPSNPRTRAKLAFTAREIDARNVTLLIEAADPHKDPLTFPIQSLRLTGVDSDGSMQYDAQLTNPKPRGDLHATGHFGPWNPEQPRRTALDGQYELTHADLGTIHGLAGTLSSTGQFAGVLDRLTVDGVTATPDFALDISNHPLPLRTSFHAFVDATTGDTQLAPVDAWLAHTHIVASGLVRKVEHQGHDIALAVRIPQGRMEDMLELGVKSDRPMMHAPVALQARLHIPPGKQRVAQKIELTGSIQTHGIVFTNPAVQDKIDALSYRAQGRPEESTAAGADHKAEVSSTLTTRFALAHGVVLFDGVHYVIPGADLRMNGAYLMGSDQFAFRGHVKTDAKPSQMMTGWKSLLLKAIDPFLAKDGAGMELGVAIDGRGKDVHFGLARHGTADDSAQTILSTLLQPSASEPAAAAPSRAQRSGGLVP